MLSFLLSLLGIGRDGARAQDAAPPDKVPGFKDVLKNPGLLRSVQEFFGRREQAAEDAKLWSDERVEKELRHYIFEGSGCGLYDPPVQLLTSLGSRIHTPLLKLLQDESLREKLAKVAFGPLLPEAPVSRLAALLAGVPCVEAVPWMAKFADEPSEYIRSQVGLAIGAAASDNAVEPLRRLLADKKDHVVSMTLNGIRHAHRAKRVDAQVAQELIPELKKLTGNWMTARDAAPVMLMLDRPAAIAWLTSPEIFSVSNKGLSAALDALADEKVEVPRGPLVALVDELLSKADQKQKAAVHDALHLLGIQRHPDDKSRLEAALRNEDEWIGKGAAEGLLAWHGLDDFEKRIWEAMEKDAAWAALKPAQKHWGAARAYDSEVNNGGHSQYFLNGSGDYWADAVAGLEAMGSKERLGILREALGQFGKQGPAADSEVRQDQLAKLIRRNEEAFGAMDERYFKSKEIMDVLLARYVIAHAEDFR